MNDRVPAEATRRGPTPAVWIATALIALSCAGAIFTGARRMILGAGERPAESPFALNPFWLGPIEVLLPAFLLGCQYLAAFRRRWPHALVVAALFCLSGLLIVCVSDPRSALEATVGGAHLFAGIVMGRWGWRLFRRR